MPKMNHQGFWASGGGVIPVSPTVTPIRYTSEFLVGTYTFTDGRDLDTRTFLSSPSGAMSDYIGWGRTGTSGGIVQWGGDNTGVGLESVAIDVNAFKTAYPNNSTIIVDFRCFWYGTVGNNPVTLSLVLYKGGSLVKSGYGFTNPTAGSSKTVSSTAKTITLKNTTRSSNGQGLARLTYNVYSGVGWMDTSIA